MRRALPLLILLALPSPAAAFVYLEHGYFTDRACHAALDRLAALPALGQDVELTARYLALAVLCPTQPLTGPYCRDDQKQATALMHVLGEPPDEAGESPITAGDLSALGDHVSRFGPINRLPRATRDGLLARLAEWLFLDDDGVGGVVADVAEEQCLAAAHVPWAAVEQDVAAALAAGDVAPVPEPLRRPMARVDPPRGPVDPDGLFTFDNPHYLDMVERNAAHFAPAAHGHWAGFHGAANALAEQGCAAAMGLDDADLDERADEAGRPARGGCGVVADQLVARLERWAAEAPARWVDPVRLSVRALRRGAAPVLRQALPGAYFGAALEAAGQHFLQDQFSGGHIRVDRGALGLQESRYDHDRDGAHGVHAWRVTGAGGAPFVAFGDGRLLGPRAGAERVVCDVDAPPAGVTDCLVRHQRGLVVLASAASFVDWALGNPLQTAPPAACADRPGLARFACRQLPLQPVRADGAAPDAPARPVWVSGDLPNPPPRFDWEGLGTGIGLDPQGGHNRLAMRLKLHAPIGRWAHWARSHQVEVASRATRWELAYGHVFHFRWAARFLLDAGAFTWLGGGGDAGARFGLAPHGGVTFLPEGWIKAPLSFGAAYHPLIRLAGDGGAEVEGHYTELWLGLAFL